MSEMKFRYQLMVLAIQSRKGFAKFMILIALFKKFPRTKFVANVKVCNMSRCSSKSDELRNIISTKCRTRNITI